MNTSIELSFFLTLSHSLSSADNTVSMKKIRRIKFAFFIAFYNVPSPFRPLILLKRQRLQALFSFRMNFDIATETHIKSLISIRNLLLCLEVDLLTIMLHTRISFRYRRLENRLFLICTVFGFSSGCPCY